MALKVSRRVTNLRVHHGCVGDVGSVPVGSFDALTRASYRIGFPVVLDVVAMQCEGAQLVQLGGVFGQNPGNERGGGGGSELQKKWDRKRSRSRARSS